MLLSDVIRNGTVGPAISFSANAVERAGTGGGGGVRGGGFGVVFGGFSGPPGGLLSSVFFGVILANFRGGGKTRFSGGDFGVFLIPKR